MHTTRIYIDGATKSAQSETTGFELYRLAGHPEKLTDKSGKVVPSGIHDKVVLTDDQEFTVHFKKAEEVAADQTAALKTPAPHDKPEHESPEYPAPPKPAAEKAPAEEKPAVTTEAFVGHHDTTTSKPHKG